MPNQGSVNILKGFYKDSRGSIILPTADYSVSALTTGQTIGCKNKLFVYSNGVSTGALLTSLSAPTGETVYADLEHPVYLDHTKQYIAGDTLKDPTMSYQTAINNYTTHGSVTVTNGITQTPLTNTNYIQNSNGVFSPGTNSWEFTTKITTPASLGTNESIFVDSNTDQKGFRIGWQNHSGQRWQFLVSTGSSWISTSSYYSTSYVVQPNTTYWIKAGCHKNAQDYTYYLRFSLDGVTYTDNVSYTNSRTMGGYQMRLGSHDSSYPFNGTMDLKETSLTSAGSLWWNALQTEGLTVSDCLVYDDSTDTTYWRTKSSKTDVIATSETLKHYNPIRLSNASGIEAVPTIVSTGYDTGKAVCMNNPKTAVLGVDNPYAFNVSQAVSSTSVADYTAIGTPTASESMLTGFSAENYVKAMNTIGGPRNAFEFKFFTTTGDSSNTTTQSLVNFDTSTGCYGVYINNGTTITVGKRSGQLTTFPLEGVTLQQGSEGVWVRCKRTPTAFSAEIVEDPAMQYSSWEDIPESAWVSIGSIGVDSSEASDTMYLGNDAGFTSYYYTGYFDMWSERMKWLSPSLQVTEWTPYQATSAAVIWKANDWTAIGSDVASEDYRVYSTNNSDREFSTSTLWNLSLGSQKCCANLVAFNTSASELIAKLNCLGTGYESSSYPYPAYDYTGYRVYFNSDYSAITNVEQYGQKCKIFKNGTGYVALKDSEGSSPTKAYTATSTAPAYNLVIDYPSSTNSFTYDSTANTVTIEGIVFNYVGSCLANV